MSAGRVPPADGAVFRESRPVLGISDLMAEWRREGRFAPHGDAAEMFRYVKVWFHQMEISVGGSDGSYGSMIQIMGDAARLAWFAGRVYEEARGQADVELLRDAIEDLKADPEFQEHRLRRLAARDGEG